MSMRKSARKTEAEVKRFVSINGYKHVKRDNRRLYIICDSLKVCAKQKDLNTGRRIHADILKRDLLGENIIVGNSLLNMYAKCGALAKAQEVFDELPIQDVVSWNTLLAGYVQHDHGEGALHLFECMQCRGNAPNAVTYLCILKACSMIETLEKGQEIHLKILKEGMLGNNELIGNALIDMYAKCGELGKAREVFENLPVRNVVSWNTLIAGYSQHGFGQHAIDCFEQMKHHGPPPDSITFSSILKACSSTKNLGIGEGIHTQIGQYGLQSKDMILGNALVDMYAKCGELAKAQEVFDKIPYQDIISWNVLISGYSHYDGEKALNCFDQMECIGLLPNAVTFLVSLQACATTGNLKRGREIQAKISRDVFLVRDVSLSNAILNMYVQCNVLSEAQDIFDNLYIQNVISWNELITSYFNEGYNEEVVKYFEQMQLYGSSPTALTFVYALKACGNLNAANKGHEIHASIVRSGFLEKSIATSNSLVDMYMKCGLLCEAQTVFSMLSIRNLLTWNVLISGYVSCGYHMEILNFLERMLLDGISPNAVTFILLLKALGRSGSAVKGMQMHFHIIVTGYLEDNNGVRDALIDMYAKVGMFLEACELFNSLRVQDIYSWNALITGYVQQGYGKEALACYEEMQLRGLFPAPITLICSLNACGIAQQLPKGHQILSIILKEGLLELGVIATAVVDMYAKCMAFAEVEEILERHTVQDVIAWNVLIEGYLKHANYGEALHSLGKMQLRGLLPAAGTFISLLKACGSAKALYEGQVVHAEISRSSLLSKDTRISCAIMDMYLKCGVLVKARELFHELPLVNIRLWNRFIAGCVRYGYSREILDYLEQMQALGIFPDSVTFINTLRACGSCGKADKGKHLHAMIFTQILGVDIIAYNAVIDMYAKCGLLKAALEILDKHPFPDLVSWNMLIAGYIEHGFGIEALHCFEQMQQEGLLPDAVAIICSLRACGVIGAVVLEKGKGFHSQVIINGLIEKDTVIGNVLIDMYVKCGAITKAQEVFTEIPVQDIVSWNILIAGHVQNRHGEEGIDLFDKLQVDLFSPDIVTFHSLVKSCSSLGNLQNGQTMHAHIARYENLEKDIVVGNALVDMYAKCGAFVKAQEVFQRLLIKTGVSWNALIAGYAEHGYIEAVLSCFDQMKFRGFLPDMVTFVFILKACVSHGSVVKGQEIHCEIVKYGCLEYSGDNGELCNTLIDMYGKFGCVIEAEKMFSDLQALDVVSWNVLIAAHVEHGDGYRAIDIFKQMLLRGFHPDVVTFLCTLKACNITGAYDQGKDIHCLIARGGWLQKDTAVGNSLIDMYAKCGKFSKALEVFHSLPVRNAVTWNTLIVGYEQHGNDEEVLNCLLKMQHEGISPDGLGFAYNLKACGNTGAAEQGQVTHAQIIRGGLLEGHHFLAYALMDMYSKCAMLDEARHVFGELISRDTVSWNVLIAGYAQSGRSEDVFTLLDEMMCDGHDPNPMTFTIYLTACNHRGHLEEGERCLWAMVVERGIIPTVEHFGCMVDLVGRAGQSDYAWALLQQMPYSVNVSVWNSLLGFCQRQGFIELGRLTFEHVVQLDEGHAAAYVGLSNAYASADIVLGGPRSMNLI